MNGPPDGRPFSFTISVLCDAKRVFAILLQRCFRPLQSLNCVVRGGPLPQSCGTMGGVEPFGVTRAKYR